MIDCGKFELALKCLEKQYANHRRESSVLSDLDREGIAESIIRCFKICYDCLWKALKLHLAECLGSADLPNSSKPVFRIAHENQ